MTKTRKLLNKELDNDHYLEDYKRELENQFSKEYNKMFKAVLALLRPYLGIRITQARATQLKKAMKEIVGDFANSIKTLTEDELQELTEIYWESWDSMMEEVAGKDYQTVEFQEINRLFTKKVPVNNKKVANIHAVILSAPAMFLASMDSLIDRMAILEEDSAQIIDIQYTSAANRLVKDSRTVSATAVAIGLALVREAFYKRSRDIVGWIHNSILDASTTQYCLDRHNKFWRFDRPELSTLPDDTIPGTGHYNCRSGSIPLLRGEVVEELPTYEEWFEDLSDARKAEILGARRYDMYKKGEIRIQDISDGQGNRLTLKQLREKIINR